MTEDEWRNCTDPTTMVRYLRATQQVSERRLRLFAVACSRRLWKLLDEDICEHDVSRAVAVAELLADANAAPAEIIALRRRVSSHPIVGCPAGYDLNYAAQRFWAPIAALEFAVQAAARTLSDRLDATEIAGLSAFAEAATWFNDRGSDYALAHFADHVTRLGPSGTMAFATNFRHGADLYRKQILTERGWEWEEEAEVEEANGYAVLVALDEARQAQCSILRDIFGNPFRPLFIDAAWTTDTVLRLAQLSYDERQMPERTLDPRRLAELADALVAAGCDNADLLRHLRGPGPHVRGCHVVDLVLSKG